MTGRPIVEFDKEAERRLVRKLDLYTVPTVSVLYLFTFIDVSGREPRAVVVSD